MGGGEVGVSATPFIRHAVADAIRESTRVMRRPSCRARPARWATSIPLISRRQASTLARAGVSTHEDGRNAMTPAALGD